MVWSKVIVRSKDISANTFFNCFSWSTLFYLFVLKFANVVSDYEEIGGNLNASINIAQTLVCIDF